MSNIKMWVEDKLAGWYHRPIKYLPERWDFVKKIVIPSQLVGAFIGSYLMFYIIWVNQRLWLLLLCGVGLVFVLILEQLFKKQLEGWYKLWYVGKKPKWLIFVVG
jgi:hypothetical protein